MAVTNSPLVQGMTGVVGGLLFRNVQGKTVVSTCPSELTRWQKSRQSERQRRNRDRFREASDYAKKMMRDPSMRDMKEYYWQKARKLKLPNGYTAAVADFMRKTKIQSVNTKRYTGKPGSSISITAQKKDFVVQEVNITLTTKEGQEIEKGAATRTTTGEWIYTSTVPVSAPESITILVETRDRMRNKTFATRKGKDLFPYKVLSEAKDPLQTTCIP
jgi:hypothetical protein